MKRYALLGAVGLCLATPSFAASVINFDGKSGTFGNANIMTAAFTDTMTFDISKMGLLGATISSIAIDASSDLNFTSVTLNGVEFTNVVSDGYEFRALRSLAVLPGLQTLVVSGTTGGNASYAGTLAFTAAVPEPAAWALMIGGFGMVGGVMRRRARQVVRVTYA